MPDIIDEYKHVVLCVDQTPSMNYKLDGSSIMDSVSTGVEAFAEVFKKRQTECEELKINFTYITFGTHCVGSGPFSIDKFAPKFTAQTKGEGRACIAEALNKACECLRPYNNCYVVLISDGIVDPNEDESELAAAIESLDFCKCYAVGFSCENGDKSLPGLLDFYTNRQIKAYTAQKQFTDELVGIAEDILAAELNVSGGNRYSHFD